MLKQIKKYFTKFLIGLFILFLFLSIIILTYQYLDHYQLLNAKKTEAVVAEKVVKKNFFLPHSYFVMTDSHKSEVDAIYDATHHYVTKRKMNQLKIGDTLTGFTTDGNNFSTVSDLIHDSVVYIIAIFIFISILFIFIYPSIERIKFMKRPMNRMREILMKYTINHPRFKQVLFGLIICVLCFFTFNFLFQAFHRVVPLNQSETEAIIMEKNYERTTGPRFHINHYLVTLAYEVNNDKHFVITEVPKQIYRKSVGETVTISYRRSNTYDVFISEGTLEKLFDWIISIRTFLFGLLIVLLYYSVKLFIKEVNIK